MIPAKKRANAYSTWLMNEAKLWIRNKERFEASQDYYDRPER